MTTITDFDRAPIDDAIRTIAARAAADAIEQIANGLQVGPNRDGFSIFYAGRSLGWFVDREDGCDFAKELEALLRAEADKLRPNHRRAPHPLLEAPYTRCSRHEEKVTADGPYRLCGCPTELAR